MTQNNLGNAYRTLAEVREKDENAKRAISAYEAALEIRTIEKYPVDYAMTQNNLGAAYHTLAEVREKEENAKRAISAYEAALGILCDDTE
jgi:tetratricopeptide (TPR) repeat protein